MSKVWAAVIASVVAASAVSQAPPVLYAAVRVIKDQNITLKSWGSGTIAETDESAWEGTHSIRISTRNFFQGGLIDLANPVDLSGSYGDKNNLLRLMISVPTASTTFGGPGKGAPGGRTPGGIGPGVGGSGGKGSTGGPTGGSGGYGPGGPGGSRGGPGGMPGGTQGGPGGISGGRGVGMGPSTGSGTTGQDLPLNIVRVIVLTTDGNRSEAYIPMPTSKQDDNGYRPLAVPLQAISGFDRTNKIVKEIGLSGDAVATFYIGNISIINDATPITGDTNYHDLNLALGDEITLGAIGYGGASVLRYTWNFGEGGDPSQVDAEGQFVTHKFRKPGDTIVTLTISDKFGLKKPFTTIVKVSVNP